MNLQTPSFRFSDNFYSSKSHDYLVYQEKKLRWDGYQAIQGSNDLTSKIHFTAANSEKVFYQGKELSSYVNTMTAAMLLNKLCPELSLLQNSWISAVEQLYWNADSLTLLPFPAIRELLNMGRWCQKADQHRNKTENTKLFILLNVLRKIGVYKQSQ